jgi:hypothetical protein
MLEPITAEEIKKLIKEAVKTFGSYSYKDKGPREVMDIDSIVDRFQFMEAEDVVVILFEVRKVKDYGEDFVREILVSLQEVKKMDQMYSDERISDLY